MDSQSSENVIGIPASSVTYETWKLGGAVSTCDSSQVQKIRTKESVVHWMNKLTRKQIAMREESRIMCFLSTTAGPIAGLLFISTRRIAFHSDRSIKLTSTNKETARIPYKVVIPLKRMKRVTPSENEAKPAQKYIQVVTEDGFEFWFMGFVLYERSFRFLQQAIYISP
ncbi:hypothetical protein HPP92_012476 [Vanilla planifolia]|uniref:GRAM domain-containing protein n=1 Tax=Vanilla planifolia TaxID=51239 RepID=A0A835UXK6_VANPL|nr:hypothetical protein HPP92_012476 [Vanilla planifolia]